MRTKLILFAPVLCLMIFVQCAESPPSETSPPKEDEGLQLFILAGQSNMAGRGEVQPQDEQPPQRVLKLNKNGEWVPATEPVHYDKPVAGVGPGRSFGLALAEQDSTITIGLIPCAVGGSSITSWKPGGFHDQTQSHPYDDCMERIEHVRGDGTLKSILWHQGASDSDSALAPPYKDRLYQLVERFRNDLNTPNLPFIAGQLGNFEDNPWDRWKEMVNQANASLSDSLPHTAFVSSEGLTHKGDRLHFDSPSARELGKRYAEAYLRLQNENKISND